jgi:hypothetical protein
MKKITKILLKYPIFEIIFTILWWCVSFIDTILINISGIIAAIYLYMYDFFVKFNLLRTNENNWARAFMLAMVLFVILKIVIYIFAMKYFLKWKNKFKSSLQNSADSISIV